MNKYQVCWDERHTSIVEAASESEAIELVNEGQGDESAEMNGSQEACKI